MNELEDMQIKKLNCEFDNQLKILQINPSLNTQSCIRGLLVVRDFYFWAVKADGRIQKKGYVLLGCFFHVFRCKK